MESDNRSSQRIRAGQEDCLVCFTSLNGGRGFAQVLHQGEMAKFCSLECMEIFQNNPASFLRRMNPLGKTVPPVDPSLLDSAKTDPMQRKTHDA